MNRFVFKSTRPQASMSGWLTSLQRGVGASGWVGKWAGRVEGTSGGRCQPHATLCAWLQPCCRRTPSPLTMPWILICRGNLMAKPAPAAGGGGGARGL